MAEPLKAQFGPDVVVRLAATISSVTTRFDADGFTRRALTGFETLELLDRGRHIADALEAFLPTRYADAIDVLLASLPDERMPAGGMASFFYLPHTEFVRRFGVPHFDDSMRAMHALTQVFTAEFAMRPFLEAHQEASLARLHEWTRDSSEHVRRLVSESTRTRLPWAPRLRAFQRDPAPVLALLETLKDDPALYVRRSVANSLNDIGKDNDALLIRTARRWSNSATPERRWIIAHALRSLVKGGNSEALAVLGYHSDATVSVSDVTISPPRPRLGASVSIACTLSNPTRRTQRVVADLRIHFVKSTGQSRIKVFKMATMELAPGASSELRKSISLANLTTRQHYPGRHAVDLQLNGAVTAIGAFTIIRRRSESP